MNKGIKNVTCLTDSEYKKLLFYAAIGKGLVCMLEVLVCILFVLSVCEYCLMA